MIGRFDWKLVQDRAEGGCVVGGGDVSFRFVVSSKLQSEMGSMDNSMGSTLFLFVFPSPCDFLALTQDLYLPGTFTPGNMELTA